MLTSRNRLTTAVMVLLATCCGSSMTDAAEEDSDEATAAAPSQPMDALRQELATLRSELRASHEDRDKSFAK